LRVSGAGDGNRTNTNGQNKGVAARFGFNWSQIGVNSKFIAVVLDMICQCFTMFHMRTAKTVSITLPPDLLIKAQELASREHRTMSELFREALRRYMTADTQWENLLMRTRNKGRSLGIKNEEDVERLSDKYRRDKRR
jgi:predicted transcriptional regulator